MTLPDRYSNWVGRMLEGQDLSGTGALVAAYESGLSTCFGRRYAIAVSSGTAALHAAYASVEVRQGSRVIVSPLSAVMTAAPLLALGAIPVFVDTERNGFGFDPSALRRTLATGRFAAIVPCGMWGTIGLTDEVVEIASEFGTPIIEDAAQSMGAGTDKGAEGCKGLIGCFSTHANKLLSTGEGGFILTDDDAIAARIRSFIRIGFDSEAGYGSRPGLNYKLSSLQAALGLERLSELTNTVAARAATAAQWLGIMQGCAWLRPLVPSKGSRFAPYAQLAIIDRSASVRAPEMARALHENGVPNDYWRYKFRLLEHYPIYKSFSAGPASLPNAVDLLDRLVVLPTTLSHLPTSFEKIEAKLGVLEAPQRSRR